MSYRDKYSVWSVIYGVLSSIMLNVKHLTSIAVPSAFSALSAFQLEFFTRQITPARDLSSLLELDPNEKLTLTTFLNYFRDNYKPQEEDDRTTDITTMDVVREELFSGRFWLGLTFFTQMEVIPAVFTQSDLPASDIYDTLASAFSKLHAAAWAGLLEEVIGRLIFIEGVPPEQVKANDLISKGLEFAADWRRRQES